MAKKSDKSSKKKGQRQEQVVHGLDVFSFWNGDAYIGEYTATSNRKLMREGEGKYCTDDGSIYTGTWSKDMLVQGNILFKDGMKFTGTCEEGKYTGEGIYHIPEVGDLVLTFKKNFPEGSIKLVDIEGITWNGTTVDNTAVLYPKNQFIIPIRKPQETISEEGESDVVPTSPNKETSYNETEEKEP
ncbi:hypothetical protein AAG570_002169 [Ranatra chinensis]|uniref:MORN repeat-containing protein 5 n=1 Tax=Ranatra chinensis TaxID=642074 RepID=A0ABD0Y788_9HEMI